MPQSLDYYHSESNESILLTVDITGIDAKQQDIDIYISECYIKINIAPALLILDLYDSIDLSSTLSNNPISIIPNKYIQITLYKHDKCKWAQLTTNIIDKQTLIIRRQRSIDNRTSFDSDRAALLSSNTLKLQQSIQSQTNEYAHHQHDTIRKLKQQERVVSLNELNLNGWKSPQSSASKHIVNDDTFVDRIVLSSIQPIHQHHITIPNNHINTSTLSHVRTTINITAQFSNTSLPHHTARNALSDSAPIVLNNDTTEIDKLIIDAETMYDKAYQFMCNQDYTSSCNLLTQLISSYSDLIRNNKRHVEVVVNWYSTRAQCYCNLSRLHQTLACQQIDCQAAIDNISTAIDLASADHTHLLANLRATLTTYEQQFQLITHSHTDATISRHRAVLNQIVALAIQYYTAERYNDAADQYTYAIKHCTTNTSIDIAILKQLFTDRAACHLQLQQYVLCIADCKQSLLLDSQQSDSCNDSLRYHTLTNIRYATALAYSGDVNGASELYNSTLQQLFELDDAHDNWYTQIDKQCLLEDTGILKLQIQ